MALEEKRERVLKALVVRLTSSEAVDHLMGLIDEYAGRPMPPRGFVLEDSISESYWLARGIDPTAKVPDLPKRT